MAEETKKKIEKIAKILGGITCTVIGMMIGGFGIKQFIPEKKKYYGGTVGNYKTVSSDPPKEEE